MHVDRQGNETPTCVPCMSTCNPLVLGGIGGHESIIPALKKNRLQLSNIPIYSAHAPFRDKCITFYLMSP